MKHTGDCPALPSREEVLAFVRSQGGAAGKRDIARHFGLKGADKIPLKALLRELYDEGVIDKAKRRIHRAGDLPPVLLADITRRDSDGDLLAEPVEWDSAHGKPPVIVIATPRRPKSGDPAPAIGDRVLVRILEGGPDDDARPSARVMKVLERGHARTLGVFRALSTGGGRLVPIDKKAQGREIVIPEEASGDAEDGDLVSVDAIRAGRFGPPLARVKERLGNVKSEKAISLIAIVNHDIPHVFPPSVLAEAARLAPPTLAGREDWRALPLVTIDPADAKDHDDAVHAEADPDPANPGGFIVTIAIADVAAYVHFASGLDDEAQKRGNSVYFPDRVVPMLPEVISNELCSLKPQLDRAALACRVVIRADGRRKSHSFHRVLMRSIAKLAYPQAQAAIDGHTDDTTRPLLMPVLKPLWAAYEALKRARDDREPLDLDLPERKILLNADGTVDRVIVPERLDAHRLIEEMMILANVCAAESLEKAHVPCMYRIHDAPSAEKAVALKEFLRNLGLGLATATGLRPAHFNGILARVKGTENADIVNQMVLRSQAQAEYSPDNIGHFGLNLRRYAHFTSPIRRYADVLVHRGLIRALNLGPDGLNDLEIARMPEIAAEISAAERRAMAAERETVDRLIAHHLAERIGEIFEGRIAGVNRAGLFVKLHDTGADGFIPAATIGGDYYRYEEAHQALIGNRTGESWRLGDDVSVKLVEAAPVAGALRFELVSDSQRRVARSGGSGKPRKTRTDGPWPPTPAGGKGSAGRGKGAGKGASKKQRKSGR